MSVNFLCLAECSKRLLLVNGVVGWSEGEEGKHRARCWARQGSRNAGEEGRNGGERIKCGHFSYYNFPTLLFNNNLEEVFIHYKIYFLRCIIQWVLICSQNWSSITTKPRIFLPALMEPSWVLAAPCPAICFLSLRFCLFWTVPFVTGFFYSALFL